jgi:hypothetical protein
MSRLAPILTPALASCLLAGCVLGSEEPPGCRVDHPDDCEAGWSCQAGLCVRPTTGLTLPEAGTDAADSAAESATEASPDVQSEEPAEAQADGPQEVQAQDGPSEADDGASEAAD